MPAVVLTQAELYEIYKTAALNQEPTLSDWEEGSNNDILAGAASLMGLEVEKLIVDEFKKTFLSTAEGDDLEYLAVDHYGPGFERPEAKAALAIVTFSRPTNGAGDVSIPAGTIVKTVTDANGNVVRFQTLIAGTLVGLTLNATVEAIDAGVKGNVEANKITQLESTLTDPSVTVTNSLASSGGAEEEDDAQYLQTIYRLIQSLGKATKSALVAAALEVAGVVDVALSYREDVVIGWDIATSTPVGQHFRIPRTFMYIADANGTASDALLSLVRAKLNENQAAGVFIELVGATPYTMNWKASMTLNPSGPNFTELSDSADEIEATMKFYLDTLPTGQGFDRATARAFVMAIWGPTGTNDLTDFQTQAPAGNINATTGVKILPGTMEIS